MARRRSRSRSLRGLGDTPRRHADKAVNALNTAILGFRQVARSADSCGMKMSRVFGSYVALGEAMAHYAESGRRVEPSRQEALRAAEMEAEPVIDQCIRTGPLGGMHRRRSRR